MNEKQFLQRRFQTYYKTNKIPKVSLLKNREFAFVPWDNFFMERHMGFDNVTNFVNYLINRSPKHVYSSGAIYRQPANQDMESKNYQGCDFIVDIDVDHFFTPCKNIHDSWICKNCGESGKGLIDECPSCKGKKFKTISWICESCLNVAKEEINKIIFNFLIPDFGVNPENISIAFSGHRGYHLKIENDIFRSLTTDDRREIADYISGENISFEILGLREVSGKIFGLSKESIGWSNKIMNKLEELLQKPKSQIEVFLLGLGFRPERVNAFIKSKDDFLDIISNQEHNMWFIEGFPNIDRWKKLLNGIIKELAAEIDVPVTVDTHRLIRYPGSLHGKTGFKVQELSIKKLLKFSPLNESQEELDPIVFYSKDNVTLKLEIIEDEVPSIKMKDIHYGPYKNGEKIDVPHHVAIFLLCKGVAKMV